MAALMQNEAFQVALWALVKVGIILGVMLGVVSYLIYAERKICGHIQARTEEVLVKWGIDPWGNQGAEPWRREPPPWGNKPWAPFWYPQGMNRPMAIALTILGFIFWWPVGLAVLFYMIGSGRMGCFGRKRRACEARRPRQSTAIPNPVRNSPAPTCSHIARSVITSSPSRRSTPSSSPADRPPRRSSAVRPRMVQRS